METITQSEYARVDEAYYTLWLYKELNYDVELRSLEQVTAINNWAFWDEDGSFRVVPDVGILSHVLRVTSTGIIYPHVRKYGKTLSLEDLSSIAAVVEALCLCKSALLDIMLFFNDIGKKSQSSQSDTQTKNTE